MRRAINRTLERFRNEDGGFSLPFIALMLVMLLAISAFAIDLGWFYLNGSRIQRAADSSALAGVVFLPADTGNVSAKSVDGANANGFSVGTVNGSPSGSGGPDSLTWTALADNKLQVSLTSPVNTFFLKVLGWNQLTMTRTATAEYVKPVPIGSPGNEFGAGASNLWGSINGRWTAWMQGDPFNARCDWSRTYDQAGCIDSSPAARDAHWPSQTIAVGDNDANTNELNPQFDGRGYAYGVEVQTGRTQLRVEIYDGPFRRPNGGGCGSTTTGDCDRLTFGPPAPNNGTAYGPNTTFTLYEPDGTPLDPYDNSAAVSGCTRTYAPTTGTGGGVASWSDVCTIANPSAGIYVLRVTANDGTGSNQYGVRATTNGAGANTPRVYGINYVSIYTNQPGSTSTLYLAKVDPIHAGKVLELRFFDAGEDDASASFTIKHPDDTTSTCSWRSEDGQSGSSGPCTIETTVNSGGWRPRFNAQWLTVEVDIPETYTCDMTTELGCWWKVTISNSQPHDRTTWAARIIGNPVRLVPNP